MTMFPGFLTALSIQAARQVRAFAVLVANRRAAKSLAELDSYALKDIGLTQQDVGYALSLPLFEDPTRHLAMLAAGRGGTGGGTRSPASMAARKDWLGDLPSAEPALCA